DDTWDPSEFFETYTFDFWAGPQAPIPYLGLEVVSRRRESLLVLHARAKTYEVARLDEAVTMPHLFRWRELTPLTQCASGGQSVSKVELCDRGQIFAALRLTNQDTIPRMSASGRRCFRRAVIPSHQRAHRAKLVQPRARSRRANLYRRNRDDR